MDFQHTLNISVVSNDPSEFQGQVTQRNRKQLLWTWLALVVTRPEGLASASSLLMFACSLTVLCDEVERTKFPKLCHLSYFHCDHPVSSLPIYPFFVTIDHGSALILPILAHGAFLLHHDRDTLFDRTNLGNTHSDDRTPANLP